MEPVTCDLNDLDCLEREWNRALAALRDAQDNLRSARNLYVGTDIEGVCRRAVAAAQTRIEFLRPPLRKLRREAGRGPTQQTTNWRDEVIMRLDRIEGLLKRNDDRTSNE